jgi:hypothetical protein
MMHTPNSTGTVVSPERTMKDMQRFNPKSNRIVSWSQNGGIHRSVQCKDQEKRVVSSLQMEERNGLCYIKNATLLPPPKPTAKVTNTIKPTAEEPDQPTEAPGEDPPIKDTTPTRIKPDPPGAQGMAQAKPATTDPPPPQSHRTKTDTKPRLKSTRDVEVETVEEDSDNRDQRPDDKRDEHLQEQGGMFMEPILEEEANQEEQSSSTLTKPKILKRPPPPHPPPDTKEPTTTPTTTQASAASNSPKPIQPPHHPSRLRTTKE